MSGSTTHLAVLHKLYMMLLFSCSLRILPTETRSVSRLLPQSSHLDAVDISALDNDSIAIFIHRRRHRFACVSAMMRASDPAQGKVDAMSEARHALDGTQKNRRRAQNREYQRVYRRRKVEREAEVSGKSVDTAAAAHPPHIQRLLLS